MELTKEQRILRELANEHIDNPKLSMQLLAVANSLAAHSAGAQEPVAWMYQSEDPLDGGEWFLSDTKPNRRNVRPLYTHPQPMPQTDAARDVVRDITLLAGYAEGSKSPRVVNAVRRVVDWLNCAEIERLDRAKGE